MHEQVVERLHEAKQRIDRLIGKIRELEDAGHSSDAARARDMLAVITETRDALRLRLRVAQEVAATEARRHAPIRSLSALLAGEACNGTGGTPILVDRCHRPRRGTV